METPLHTALSERTGGGEWSPDARRVAVILLAAVAAFNCLYGLRGGPPMGDHECINALGARNTLSTGEWLIPQVNDAPLIRKTPLGVWLIASSSWIAGAFGAVEPVTAFTARLPSALAGWGTVMLVAWLGSMLYGYRAGITAGFIAAGSAGIVYYARNAQVDMVLTFFVTLSLACFWRGALHGPRDRRFLAAFYVAFAMAMLAKAPLPVVMVGLSLVAYWFVAAPILEVRTSPNVVGESVVRRLGKSLMSQLRRVGSLWLIPGVLLFLVLFAAWPAYVAYHVDTAVALWRIEYLSRFTGDLSDKVRPASYYIPLIFGLLFPYMLSLPEAVIGPFLPRYRPHLRGMTFALTWAVVGTLFLSASAFKRPHYLLSVLPAYCLLLAPVVDRLFFACGKALAAIAKAACLGIPALLLIGAMVGAVVVRNQYPLLMPYYVISGVAAVSICASACWAYARDRRLTSFALLNLGTPLLVAIVWPALAEGTDLNAQTDALAKAMTDEGIPPSAAVYWVDGQASFTLPFYHQRPVRRLISEVEMASLRTGRKEVSDEVYLAAVRRIQERLKDDPPAFFVVSAGPFDLLSHRTDIAIREVLRLKEFHEDMEDELVVFTRAVPVSSPTP